MLGSLLFVFAGVAIERFNYAGMVDFREYYFGSRCLIEHHETYKQSDLTFIYEHEGSSLPSEACRASVLAPEHRSPDPQFLDFFWIVLLSINHYQGISVTFSIFSAPLGLLALATFSVWVYWRRVPAPQDAASS